MNNSQSFNIGGSTFGFSGVGVEELEASEYTLVVIAVDTSISVRTFQKEITDCVRQVVEACRKSPRADNLMIRVVEFDSSVREVHGFKELMNCNPGDYAFQCNGYSTSLFDGAFTGIGSVFDYGKKLYEDDYSANAICFVITDGLDNSSKMSAVAVGQKAEEARNTEEALESLLTVLVGVNVTDRGVSQGLNALKDTGKFDWYVEIEDANAKTLAKLADFVSQSISSQSQALGTGGPSQQINPSLAI
jgi:uncharacterized protein YegL